MDRATGWSIGHHDGLVAHRGSAVRTGFAGGLAVVPPAYCGGHGSSVRHPADGGDLSSPRGCRRGARCRDDARRTRPRPAVCWPIWRSRPGRFRAVQVELVEEIDRAGLHAVDAHASAKVMARHVCGLSGAEAEPRGRAAKALRHLPEVRAAFRAGRIGGCQVDRIARVHANPRVRDALEANEASFADQAETNSYHAFNLMVGDWVRRRRPGRHPRRQPTLPREPRRQAPPGLRRHLVHHRRLRVPARRRAQHHPQEVRRGRVPHRLGQGPRRARRRRHHRPPAPHRRPTPLRRPVRHLPEGRRRPRRRPGGSRIVTDVVIDQDTFERLATILAGGTVDEPDPLFSAFPATKYRCSTLDGEPVEATEAVAHALIGHIRRVVIGSDSVVIDLGREQTPLHRGRRPRRQALADHLLLARMPRPRHPVPVRPPRTLGPTPRRPRRRVYLPRQRGVLLRETQPGEGTRLHRPPRPRRHLAHPPPRRHRDRMTCGDHGATRVRPARSSRAERGAGLGDGCPCGRHQPPSTPTSRPEVGRPAWVASDESAEAEDVPRSGAEQSEGPSPPSRGDHPTGRQVLPDGGPPGVVASRALSRGGGRPPQRSGAAGATARSAGQSEHRTGASSVPGRSRPMPPRRAARRLSWSARRRAAASASRRSRPKA